MTATLFSGSGASLTALNASNLGSGTVPDARFPATLPAISGANLTNLNASNLASGSVPTARLGTGTADTTSYLRGDSTWQVLNFSPGGSTGHVQFNNAGVFAGSASFFWDNSNSRLGIGTASPAYPLEVAGKAKSSTLLLTPGAGGAPQGTGSATYWNQAGSDLYFMGGNVGIGTATPTVALDLVGSLTISGNGSIGGTLNSIGNFSVATDKFTVAAASGNTAIAGTLTTVGNVGIGTASPAGALDVRSTSPTIAFTATTATSPMRTNITANGNLFVIGKEGSTAGNLMGADSANAGIINVVGASSLQLGTNNTTRMTIDSSGAVGIGTATPNGSGKLHIYGGDNSFAYFGPNATWSGALWVGAGPGRPTTSTASMASSNGNLHLDAGSANDMYLNYYSSGRPVHVYGALDSTSSLQGTIFYDANNTGYYVDPNNTSNISGLTTTGAANFGGYGTSSWFPYVNGANYIRGNVYFNGTLYDEDSTGYYVNPSGDTVLYSLYTMSSPHTSSGYYVCRNASTGHFDEGTSCTCLSP